MPIWTSQDLEIWEKEAFQKITSEVPILLQRVSFEITEGNPFYQVLDATGLSYNVVGIQRLTWLGKKLTPLSRVEFRELYPHASASITSPGTFAANAFDNDAFDVFQVLTEGAIGTPKYYAYTGHDWNTIQFYPTPNVTISGGGSDLFGMPDIRAKVIATVYVSPSIIAGIPILRWQLIPIVRSYVLWRAFQKEGPGQRMDLAVYHKKKFDAGLEVLRKINEGVFISTKHRVRDNELLVGVNRRSPRRPYLYSDEIPTLG